MNILTRSAVLRRQCWLLGVARYRFYIDAIDLLGVEKLLGVTLVDSFSDEYVEQVWINVIIEFHTTQYRQSLRQRHRAFVGPVTGG